MYKIHFKKPRLSRRVGYLYDFVEHYSMCSVMSYGKHTEYIDEVTCEDCLFRMMCNHKWAFEQSWFADRKMDMICIHCRFFSTTGEIKGRNVGEIEYVEYLINSLRDDEDKLNLIYNDLKLFRFGLK